MAEEFSTDQPRPRRLGRILGIMVGGLLVLVVVLYFVVSSAAFLKGVILPRVAKALNAEVTVADASLSPFSQVTLQKLKVQPNGKEALLTAEEVRVRYSLMSILKGNYVVDELTMSAPVIQLIKEANGSSNLDPLTKGQETKPSSSKAEEPMRVSIRNVSLKDATVRSINRDKDGSSQSKELSQLNVTVDRVENGQAGKMTIASALTLDNRVAQGRPGTNDLMEGKINGTFDFKLDAKLFPQTLAGSAVVAFARGAGAYAELAGLGATLKTEVTPTEVRQLSLSFERGGQALGRIQASGPLDLAKSEGRVKLEVQSIDRQVLNLFGASHGWDFANSTLNATNFVDIARQGEVIGAKGLVVGRQVSVRQQAQSTPALDLDVDYDVAVNLADQTAVIRKLTLAGRQQQNNLLEASLNRPMTVTWASTSRGFTESTFQVAVNQLNLKDWRPVLGTNLPNGRLDWRLNLTATNDAKYLKATSTLLIQELAAEFGTNRIDQARVALSVDGNVANLKTLQLDAYTLEVQQRNELLLKVNGTAHYDLAVRNLSLQANAEVSLPVSLRQFPVAGMAASAGMVRLSTAVTQRNEKYTATGNLVLADFTGKVGAYAFKELQTGLDYNVDLDDSTVQIHSASVTVRRGYTAGGTLNLSGAYDRQKSVAQLTFKAVDINQNALGPILAPSLGDKQLTSISLNGSGSTSYDPKGEAAIKAELSVTNWVVSAPQQKFVTPVLGATVQLDGAMRQQVLDLRECLLKLSPTAKAANQLSVKAHLDMGATNATPSQVTVQADSLDLTPYYQMFSGKSTNAVAVQTPDTRPVTLPAPEPPAPGQAPGEPGPAALPVQQLTADVKIGRLYLGELAITNLQTTAKINRGEVTIDPASLTVNGAPVTAKAVLNLGVPGYIYDVSFAADGVPLEPLATTFTTNPPGTYKGDLFTQGHVQGAGVTGPNLKKNLSGNFSLNMTNLNYEIVGRKAKRLLEPIALVLRVPELMQTPLNWIAAKADVGKGLINLQQFVVKSPAFLAESRGAVTLSDVLTNSPLNLPVTLSLSRVVAQKANLLAANSPTNSAYAELPSFVTLSGTVGDPKTEINKLVIGGLLARSIGGLVPLGKDATTLLQGVGSALTGQPGAGGSAGTATNASPAANIVQGISGLLNKGQPAAGKTNAATATNASPAANIIQGISGLLNQPKKTVTNAPAATSNNKTAKPSGPEKR